MRRLFFITLIVLTATFAEPAAAYIGPGAGFAFMSSFLVLFVAIGVAILIILTFPIRMILRLAFGKKPPRGKCGRVIILGLDGLDPELAREMMESGDLPNMKKLADEGSFSPLKTTCPPISPVAWSSFTTGVNPSRHNIYDFLAPDRKTYFPVLSSSKILPPARSFKLGPISFGKPVMRLLRKGKPFWNTLADNGVFSTTLRVPITFPPEPFKGHLLSAMCVPDLKGTQGTFTFFTGEDPKEDIYEGGERVHVSVENNCVKTSISGPEKPSGGDMTIPFIVEWNQGSSEAVLKLDEKKYKLKIGEYSDWIKLNFNGGAGVNVAGICRFYLKQLDPVFELYATPINIDPDKPAMPISHPFIYSMYLSKLLGPFATLGLAEDTWALNERILDEKAFLGQAWANHAEREKMFFHSIDRTKRGVVACVFDATDRIQHMFWRYHERCDHQPLDNYDEYKDTIRDLYRTMDSLVARTVDRVKDNDVLIVMSDHGFKSFRRGVDLNAWLEKEGYLTRKKDASGEKYLCDVDWSRTRAYALGLAGIYLTLKGRERDGIVDPAEAATLRAEIGAKLKGLKDTEEEDTAVVDTHDLHEEQSGPYLDNAPDLVVGYNIGYRASWDCAVGKINSDVFENNTKSWSGDHCIDPKLVPGSFFCNMKMNGVKPAMIDIAPTVLDLLGVKPPSNMEGKPIFGGEE